MFSHLYYFEKNIENNINGTVLNLQGCKYSVFLNVLYNLVLFFNS